VVIARAAGPCPASFLLEARLLDRNQGRRAIRAGDPDCLSILLRSRADLPAV
jgi:hypothetical protein